MFLLTFSATYCIMPFVRRLAIKFNILDIPGGRKIHLKATPLLGGVAIYLGVVAGLLFHDRGVSQYWPILAGATLIVLLGVADDIQGLSAQFRIVCQVLIAMVVILSGNHIDFLPHNFWGDAAEIILTLLWIVGVTNTYNYLDGLDGLAAGSAVVNLSCFIVILFNTGQHYLGSVSIILIAAALGFLPYNFRKEKMFLGDAGSTFFGFALANIAIVGNWAGDNVVKITIPLLILAVPIFDMIFTTIMRIKEKKVRTVLQWLEYGGKDHFHHYLVDLGLGKIKTVIFIYCVTLSSGISAIMLSNDSAVEAVLTLSQATIIFGIIAVLIVAGKQSSGNTAI